jgi:hypothetical protein
MFQNTTFYRLKDWILPHHLVMKKGHGSPDWVIVWRNLPELIE